MWISRYARALVATATCLLLVTNNRLAFSQNTTAPIIGPANASPDDKRSVDFRRDIRPLLSDKCFTCHGPDENQRVGQLRLDLRQSALTAHDGKTAIVPRDLDASELIRRIVSTNPKEHMPPHESARQLTADQVDLLKRWIREGAEWTEHWSFAVIKQPVVPVTQATHWARNAIDQFIGNRLDHEGLTPSGAAAKHTLLRRLSLDLTGLPPTVVEVEAFVKDDSPAAYDRAVDRLLASPSYGEHMAVGWLDAARYADTSGYQNDGPRFMWRWRDWVIHAFNNDLPFDQFTIEQIAGDLLENPSLEQLIATGFNRNHRGNAEGGIIPEEYQVEYVVDRVDTTATVWLGLTIGCARCHDHKYDPIAQKDYYKLFAYFNNLPESGRAIKEGNSPPLIKAPRTQEQEQLAWLDQQIVAMEKRVAQSQQSLQESQLQWEANFSGGSSIDWSINDQMIGCFTFDSSLSNSSSEVVAQCERQPNYVGGIREQAIELDGAAFIDAGNTANFGYFDKFSLTAWVSPDEADGTLLSKMTPVEEGPGYAIHLRNGRVQLNLVKRWLDDALRVETRDPLPLQHWSHLAVTYDGSRVAGGIKIFVDGISVPLVTRLDRLNQTFAVATEPLRIGGGERNFRGKLDELRLYASELNSTEIELLAVRHSISEILQIAAENRSAAERGKLTRYFIDNVAADEIREADHQLTDLRRKRLAFYESIPTVMVMQEMEQPRKTFVLVRGQYDLPGEPVDPGLPSALPDCNDGKNSPHNNRLGLAKWLVDVNQPLTPRVIMNRLWQHHFGQGLVRTPEDFGAQGDLPSHPELLDWLAAEFIRNGWDIKAMQRAIVSSAAYRQSSELSLENLQIDPENRLLARGPRRRLPAEAIRDQALAFAELLTSRIGGPSVKPYQPEGLWQEIATDTEYQQSHGADLYRRSLYTYWKRTVAPPTMVTMDATSREACIVQRTRTNTPLQALVMLNDTTFVESARVLAQRMMADYPTHERISRAFQLVTSRPPSPAELHILDRRYDQSLREFEAAPEAAKQLISVGEFPANETLVATELAALTTVTSLLLNLDEVVTKE